jgi:hypothetical protein
MSSVSTVSAPKLSSCSVASSRSVTRRVSPAIRPASAGSAWASWRMPGPSGPSKTASIRPWTSAGMPRVP